MIETKCEWSRCGAPNKVCVKFFVAKIHQSVPSFLMALPKLTESLLQCACFRDASRDLVVERLIILEAGDVGDLALGLGYRRYHTRQLKILVFAAYMDRNCSIPEQNKSYRAFGKFLLRQRQKRRPTLLRCSTLHQTKNKQQKGQNERLHRNERS
jgi:hypothetical protein